MIPVFAGCRLHSELWKEIGSHWVRRTEFPFCWIDCSGVRCNPRYSNFEQSPPALMDIDGDLEIDIPEAEIMGSNLLVSKTLKTADGHVIDPKNKFKIHAQTTYTVPLIKIGEKINLKLGPVDIQGNVQAGNIEIEALTMLLGNNLPAFQQAQAAHEPIQINLTAIAAALVNPHGFIQYVQNAQAQDQIGFAVPLPQQHQVHWEDMVVFGDFNIPGIPAEDDGPLVQEVNDQGNVVGGGLGAPPPRP